MGVQTAPVGKLLGPTRRKPGVFLFTRTQLPSPFISSIASNSWRFNSAGLLVQDSASQHGPSHLFNGSAWENIGRYVNPVAATNALLDSRDPSTGNWSSVGSPVVAKDQTDAFGNANSAVTITDNEAGARAARRQNITVPNDSNTHMVWARVAKDADETAFPVLYALLSGGTQVVSAISFNKNTGASDSSLSTATPTRFGAIDQDDWWLVYTTIANNGTGNTLLQYRVYPAYGGSLGGSSAATTGAIVFDAGQVVLNSDIVHPDIVTGSSTVTVAGRDFGTTDLSWLGAQPIDGVLSLTLRLVDIDNDATQNFFDLSDNTANNRIRIFSDSSGDIRSIIKNAGATVFDEQILIGTHGIGDNEEFTVSLQLAENAVKLKVNTHESALDTSATLPSGLSQIDLGEAYNDTLSSALYLKSLIWEAGGRL